MQIIIRQSTPTDFPSIFSLIKEFAHFQKTPEKVSITLEQMQAEQNVFQCFVAVADSEIVGFASFFFAYYSWSGKALYLDDLYVQQPFRHHKIGSQLLDTVIDFAKTNHCKKVRWLVSKWNDNAICFYQKMGAVVDDTDMVCDLNLA